MSTTPMKYALRILAVLILAFTGLVPAASRTSAAVMAGTYDTLTVYDNFNNPAFDGSYDQSLWAYSGVTNYVIQQSKGAMLFTTTATSGDGNGSLDMNLPSLRTPNELKQFQADLKLSPVSGNFTMVKIQIYSNNVSGHNWWTQCRLGGEGGQTTASFICDVYSDNTEEYVSTPVPVAYDTWATVRIDMNPATAQLDFYLNGVKVGSHLPADAAALVISSNLQPTIGLWNGDGGSTAVRAVDNVMISGGTGTADDFNALHIALANPYNFDPGLADSVDGMHLAGALFRGLVKTDALTGAVVPDLAESWTWNATNDEVTFTLRPGLKWSDGVDLTASDFRFAMLRALKANSTWAPYLDTIENGKDYRTGVISDENQVGIYIDSPTQLRIKLAQPDVMFIYRLTAVISFAVPEHLVTARQSDWFYAGVVISSGPYLLRGWTGDGIRLSANPFYYGAAPQIEKVIIRFAQDAPWTWNQFLQGNLDTVEMTADQVQVANQDPIVKKDIITTYNDCTFGLYFNLTSPPFNNVNVRKAFLAAIDRTQFIANTVSGGAGPTQTFTPPGIFGAIDGVGKNIGIPASATQAKQYLSNAGYPNGSGFPAVTVPVYDTPYNRYRWSDLTSRWKSVLGVTINVSYKSTYDLDGAVEPMRFVGWCADYNDAYSFLKDGIDYAKDRGYLGSWNNATYNALVAQMQQTADPNARLPLYEQAEKIITETDLVFGPLYASMMARLSRPYLHRLYTNLLVEPWEEWSIQRDDTTTYTPGAAATFTPSVDNTVYSFPSNLTTQPVTVVHTVLPPEETAPAPTGLASIGRAFRLDLTNGSALLILHASAPRLNALPPSFTITIPYSPEELQAGDIFDERMLALYANVNGQWVKQSSQVDSTKHILTATTREINTEFIVWGPATYRMFLPALGNSR